MPGTPKIPLFFLGLLAPEVRDNRLKGLVEDGVEEEGVDEPPDIAA